MRLLTLLFIVAFANTAWATEWARITNVETNYHYVWQETPTTICQNVEVPIYGTVQGEGASGGDVLTGMIIGGLLGKGASGNDKGAAAGAIIGGVIAADKKKSKQVITGYKTERQCTTSTKSERVRSIKNYRITYEWHGVRGRSYTYNYYNVGDRIPINVTINAK